jgi:hypothetical protein
MLHVYFMGAIMNKLSISLNIISNTVDSVDFSDKPDLAWKIKRLEKTPQVIPSDEKLDIISFKKIVVCKNDIDEKKVIDKLEKVFQYIDYKALQGQKEIYITYIIDHDQFGFELSSQFMQWLIRHNCKLYLRGVYFQ